MNWIKVKTINGNIILLNLDNTQYIDSAEGIKSSSKLRFKDGSERIIKMTVDELYQLTGAKNCL